MIDATISRVRLHDLARPGQASSRPGESDLMAPIV